VAYSDILGNLPESPVGRDFDVSRPVETFVPVARAAVLQPVAFFSAMPRAGGYTNPLVFAFICDGVAAILAGLLAGGGIGILTFVLTLVFEALVLFAGGAIATFLANSIIGAGRANFETTFRVLAYSAVPRLVSWIPVLGWLLGLYAVYLAIVGVREVYQTTTGNSAAVVLITGLVIAIIYGILATIVFAAVVAAIVIGGSHP